MKSLINDLHEVVTDQLGGLIEDKVKDLVSKAKEEIEREANKAVAALTLDIASWVEVEDLGKEIRLTIRKKTNG